MNQLINRRENVMAVIVTFNPDDGWTDRFSRVLGQVNEVVIVDNHSSANFSIALRDYCATKGIGLIQNEQNCGIATALNQGAHLAIQRGYDWILTLDQDSIVASDLVLNLLKVTEDFPERNKLAVIGANYRELSNGVIFAPCDDTARESWQEAKTAITSGSLVSLSAYIKIGPFREEFFIDCVDLEYCLRARSLGFHVVLTRRSLMQHPVGSATPHRLLWKTLSASNHSALRRYYQARNRLTLSWEYFLQEPHWVFIALYSFLKSVIVLCLFEEQRLLKLKYLTIGAVDGICFNFTRKVS